MFYLTKPRGQRSQPISRVALFKIKMWRDFPPRPHTCGNHQEHDEQNMSKAVRVLIFMEDYTFDLNPTDHKALHNQNNMYCIFMNSYLPDRLGVLLFVSIFPGKRLDSSHWNNYPAGIWKLICLNHAIGTSEIAQWLLHERWRNLEHVFVTLFIGFGDPITVYRAPLSRFIQVHCQVHFLNNYWIKFS